MTFLSLLISLLQVNYVLIYYCAHRQFFSSLSQKNAAFKLQMTS